MKDKELVELWRRYLETRSHGDLDFVIEELIKRSIKKQKEK